MLEGHSFFSNGSILFMIIGTQRINAFKTKHVRGIHLYNGEMERYADVKFA